MSANGPQRRDRTRAALAPSFEGEVALPGVTRTSARAGDIFVIEIAP